MIDKTILDKLVERLNQIAQDVGERLENQEELEQEVAEVGILLSGLEKIAHLLTDTFNDIDTTLLNLRTSQAQHRQRLQDSLATISTILINYPEVFVRLDVDTVRMFLENVDRETLKEALLDTDIEIVNRWYLILSNALWNGDRDEFVGKKET